MKNTHHKAALLTLTLLTALPISAQRIMTLSECIAAARTGNAKAKDAARDLSIAKEQQKYARTKYFPMLGASATHFESSDYIVKQNVFSEDFREILNILFEGSDFLRDGGIRALKRGTTAGFTLLEPLYAGGRIKNLNKLADLQVDARQKLIDVTDDEIVLTTEFLYYKILELQVLDIRENDA
jgi:outer membrane protein TolC